MSRVLQHAQESALCDQLSNTVIDDLEDDPCSSFLNPSRSPVASIHAPSEPNKSSNHEVNNDVHHPSAETSPNINEKPGVQQDSDSAANSYGSQDPESSAAALTEAKREKHRNKKQSQRAAKRAAAENNTVSNSDKASKSPSPEVQDADNSVLPSCYAISPSGDEENWNLLIESQDAHFDQYLDMEKSPVGMNDSNSWTVVVPSSSTRSQRTTVGTNASTRVPHETTDWKTTSSGNSSYKRRLSIPVSRHDIGKVIGQGPGEAVQRTYETIQGLLDGSIAGNDVLLMYNALKKSSTLPSNMPVSNTVLNSLTSRLNGMTTVTVSSTIKSGSTNTKGVNPNGKTARKTGKSVNNALIANTTRSTSTQPTALPVVNKSNKTPVVSTVSSNNNNNNTFSNTTVPLLSVTCPSLANVKVPSSGSASWSSKVINTSSSKGNFASVAAAGLNTQSTRVVKPTDNQTKNGRSQLKTTVPNLISAPPAVLSGTTATPVSLLSLNLSSYPSSSHMFPDFIPSLSNTGDFAPECLDESSFPPLSASKCTKVSQLKTATTSSTSLTDMLSVSVFDSSVSTVHTVSTSNSFPLTGHSDTSPPNYDPLTVSPPSGVANTSQPNTPAGSGGINPPATPPTATPQTKSFARAPGSERSAHQRSANITVTSVAISLSDSFPPSLLSLDVDGNTNVSLKSESGDTALFTPTKRAIASDLHNSDFRHDSISNHFRSDRSCGWQTSDASVTSLPPSAYTAIPSTLASISTSIDSSTMSSDSATESAAIVANVSQVRNTMDPLNSMPTLWPVQTADLNSTSLAFQPSFQPLNQISASLKASTDTTDSLMQASLLRNDFTSHGATDQYSLQGSQSGILRQMAPQTCLQKSHIQTTQQQVQNGNGTGLNVSGAANALPTTSAHNSPNASLRSKPSISGTSSGYLDSRPAVLNGYPNNICAQPTSMPLNTQFSSIFPVTQQQSMLTLSPGTVSGLNHQSPSGLSTRLGNSSHPMVNQTQFAMCSSGSGGSFTPPPFMPSYVPPNMQPVCNAASVIHPNTNYASHLLNGFGSPPHVGTACTPTVGSGVHVGIPSSAAQGSIAIQPIGAERRRQANTLASITSSSMIYPNMSSNSSLAGPMNSPTQVMGSPLAAMHPQTPPQQCSVNSNANSLLMAFTMNWMQQQQQQQQQHSSLVSGSTGTANPPANWPPSIWPANNLNSNFPVTCPPIKVPPGNPSEINIYNNSAMLPNTLPAVNGVTGQQHQQSLMAAAMAAMANMYPWNSNGNGGNSGLMSGVSGVSTAGSNRWVCPQTSTAFPGVNPPTSQPFYQEQYSTLKPGGGPNSGIHPGSSPHS
ncbi:unnamed protein product [Trichobilharzia regenti]|nr:unnamed protein product [Trichobilharzia regenti]